MITFIKSIAMIAKFFSASVAPAQDRGSRYLSDSVDIYDLERRMRQVDSGRHNLHAIGAHGISMR